MVHSPPVVSLTAYSGPQKECLACGFLLPLKLPKPPNSLSQASLREETVDREQQWAFPPNLILVSGLYKQFVVSEATVITFYCVLHWTKAILT